LPPSPLFSLLCLSSTCSPVKFSLKLRGDASQPPPDLYVRSKC
jgi:hypothetical protein